MLLATNSFNPMLPLIVPRLFAFKSPAHILHFDINGGRDARIGNVSISSKCSSVLELSFKSDMFMHVWFTNKACMLVKSRVYTAFRSLWNIYKSN